MRIKTTSVLGRFGRLLLVGVGAWAAVVVAFCAVTFLALGFSAPKRLPLTPQQTQLLAGDRVALFYSARRYEELSRRRGYVREIGILVIGLYFTVARDDYAQTVARNIPFRVSQSPAIFDHGLQKASERLFRKPLASITEDELERLMRFSEHPVKHPLASTGESS